jgi:hypothetical protein
MLGMPLCRMPPVVLINFGQLIPTKWNEQRNKQTNSPTLPALRPRRQFHFHRTQTTPRALPATHAGRLPTLRRASQPSPPYVCLPRSGLPYLVRRLKKATHGGAPTRWVYPLTCHPDCCPPPLYSISFSINSYLDRLLLPPRTSPSSILPPLLPLRLRGWAAEGGRQERGREPWPPASDLNLRFGCGRQVREELCFTLQSSGITFAKWYADMTF